MYTVIMRTVTNMKATNETTNAAMADESLSDTTIGKNVDLRTLHKATPNQLQWNPV